MLNIVLFEPEIPGNTGNIARSCVATESRLHLVGRLGFSLEDKYLKRAGLDYWLHLDITVHERWEHFLKTVPDVSRLFFYEKDAEKLFWDAKHQDGDYLVFGAETRGFPRKITQDYAQQFYRLPMTGKVRSLNLSSTVSAALYQALHQLGYTQSN